MSIHPYTFKRAAGITLLSCSLVLSAADSHEPLSSSRPSRADRPTFTGDNPFAPTVTRSESELLQSVAGMSADDSDAALQTLKQAITDTSSPALDFALGNLHYQNDQLQDAETAYVHAVRKLPTFRAALNNLARVYLTRDKPRRAMAVFQSLIRDGQGDAQTYALLGHALSQLDQTVSAEGAYRHALLLAPGDSVAMRGLARALIAQDRSQEVLALTRELQQNAPYDAELWALRANAHIALEEYDQAIIVIETARLLDATPEALLPTLGDLYLNREQTRDAAAAYDSALESQRPDIHRIVRAARSLLQLDAVALATSLTEKAAALGGQVSAEDHQHLEALQADLMVRKGLHAEAEQRYRALIRENPLNGDVLIALARLQITKADISDARLHLERASRIQGFETRALIALGQLEVDQGHYDLAIPLLERAQAIQNQAHVARYLKQVQRLASQ